MSEEKKKKKKKKKASGSGLQAPGSDRGLDTERKALPEPADPKLLQEAPELAHDDREIEVGVILRFAAVLAVATAVVLAGMWSFTKMMKESSLAGAPEPSPMATELPDGPPDPKLQPNPRDGLNALRAAEKRDLESYGWVDEKSRIVRIPIARAMDILAERGLPTRQMGPPEIDPVTVPTDGSLEPPHTREEAK